ncbi:alpha/beta fold hydrolase [Azotobacter vinelandii]
MNKATKYFWSPGAISTQAALVKTWDNFIQDAAIKAIKVTRAISGGQPLNCVGFCIGGTLLSTALAVLEAQGSKDHISSLTLLATFLDYSDTGVINVFVDEQFVTQRERTIGGKGGPVGLFRGQDMGNTFSLLRPNELWWNYTVDKYLKGQKNHGPWICCSGIMTVPIFLAPCTVGIYGILIYKMTLNQVTWSAVESGWI